MKRSKRLYILLAVLVVACAATFGLMKYEEHKENIKNSDEVILQISSDTVTAVSWTNETDSLSFHKGDNWLYDEDEAFPVDEESIDELLDVFEEFGVSFIIEDVDDFGQYGLDDPVCIVQITTTTQLSGVDTAYVEDADTEQNDTESSVNAYTYEIKLGNFSNMDSQRYVSIGDGNVYLVETDPLDYFDAVLSDMIDHDETPSFENITGITFEGSENYEIIYQEDSANSYCKDDLYFAQIGSNSLPLDTGRTEEYAANISLLSPTNYVNYKVTDEELAPYGLDTPELTATINYTYEDENGESISDSFVIHIGRNQEEVQAAEEAAEKAQAEEDVDYEPEEVPAYVRIGDSQIIYEISSGDYDKLMAASYNDLRHLEVFSADFADVTQIDISLEGVDYTISSQVTDEERTYFYLEEELSSTGIQSAIEALKADSFTDEQATQKKEISLTLHLDNENFPEVTIDLYRYDGSNCLAVVDGKPVSLVSRSQVVDLIEAVNEIVLD